jgi:putative endonuclease
VNAGERRALWHYRLRGYRILGTNVQAGRNELDLIVRQGKELTFVEVKERRGSGFGGAVGAVDAEKGRRVRRAAQVWLSRNPQRDDVRVGFEVVAVEQGRLLRIPASLSDDSRWQGDGP